MWVVVPVAGLRSAQSDDFCYPFVPYVLERNLMLLDEPNELGIRPDGGALRSLRPIRIDALALPSEPKGL